MTIQFRSHECLIINGKKQVGAAVVSYVDERIGEHHFLIGSKRDDNQQLYFVSPGGEIETSDATFEAGALRELEEETRFDLQRFKTTHPSVCVQKIQSDAYSNRDVHYFHIDLGTLNAGQVAHLQTLVRTVKRHDLDQVQFVPVSLFGKVGQNTQYPVQKKNLIIFQRIAGLIPPPALTPLSASQSASKVMPHRQSEEMPQNLDPSLRPAPAGGISAQTFLNAMLVVSGTALIVLGVVALYSGVGGVIAACGISLAACGVQRFFSRPVAGAVDTGFGHQAATLGVPRAC